MREQDVLHFRTRDVVAGGDNHVVGAGLVPEVAVFIHAIGVAGEVPSLLDVLLLTLDVVEIAAACGT